MKSSLYLFSFLVSALLTFSSSNVNSQSLESLIGEGDKYYKEFNNEKALEIYKKADKSYPANWEILWRISRAYVDIGEHMPASTDEQEDKQIKTYETALMWADSSVQLAPDKSITHLRRAIANGRIALFKGVFSVAGVVNQVRDDIYKSLALNNAGTEIEAVGNYILARTHGKVSAKWSVARAALGLGWADLDSAWIYYDKALKLDNNFMMIHLDKAKLLIEEDELEKAKVALNAALKCSIRDEDDNKRIEETKELLKQIAKEEE